MTQYKVVELNCPGCNAPVATDQKECIYCSSPVVITSFSSVYQMDRQMANKFSRSYKEALVENPEQPELQNSIGMIYLKLKLYEQAQNSFEKAIEKDFDNSETYFYKAISLLEGKKAFIVKKENVDKAINYTNTALQIEERGIYYYFLAYLKYDFYHRKFLKLSPNYIEELEQAKNNHISEEDIRILFELLNVARPKELSI